MNTYQTAFDTAERLLARALPRRWRHVQAVGRKALEVGTQLFPEESTDILAMAAILHDVGYSPALVKTGFHPLDGARWLRTEGWDERVVALVAHHSCATIEADERGLRKELESEFVNEDSAVTQALWFCDMTTGPDGNDLEVEVRLAEILERYGPDHVVTRFIRRARPLILDAVRQTEQRLAA
ncbi:HD domain-containing protein [Glycomyces buryatensis]|uniref:HD domain-containing protein n=1 Tax=Glycomyces buryatensis TaxID=2570927 RepID=A0A4S8QG60_9ACTN|nr:HD domain-containing protein [Glycomyces buryatensis]THV41935.1 HD domain-containing protein [Glycomyces buryatensis]